MKKLTIIILVSALVLLMFSVALAATVDFTLNWFTVDNGGGSIQEGDYTLTGVIGQPDAGDPLNGGEFTLIGGFLTRPQTTVDTCPVALNDVDLNGLNTGFTNVEYTFSAAPLPANVTQPLTYTWSTSGLVRGQGNISATYTWPTDGPHAVNLTAQNCGGSVNTNHVITLTTPSSCPNPLSGVSLTGDSQGVVNRVYTFTTSLNPVNATPPIDYAWSAEGLVSGQGTAQAVYRWMVGGRYTVSVQTGNCGGTQQTEHGINIQTPLTAVSINGAGSGTVGQTLTYQAIKTPAAATEPVTYTWSMDGLVSGQASNTVEYRWDSAGQKVVELSAYNAGGYIVTASQVVNIATGCGVALSDADISGFTSGLTGTNYIFTARPSPATATTPLTYTWSADGLVQGQGNITATYNWPIDGSHTINLTVENCGGSANASHVITLTSASNCTLPLTGVALDGLSQGDINHVYTFTAELIPTNATAPVSYVWATAGLTSAQDTAQAVYYWPDAGAYTVTVQATNCGGAYSAQHRIDISGGRLYLPLILR